MKKSKVKSKSTNIAISLKSTSTSYTDYLIWCKKAGKSMTKTYIEGPKELIELFKTNTIKKLSPAIMELIYNTLKAKELI